MQKSKKLSDLADKIEQLLRDNDVAGAICLHEPGHGESRLVIDPSYSCAKVLSPTMVGFESKLEEYSGDKLKQVEHQTNTANMLELLGVMSHKHAVGLVTLSIKFGKTVGAEHGPLRSNHDG